MGVSVGINVSKGRKITELQNDIVDLASYLLITIVDHCLSDSTENILD